MIARLLISPNLKVRLEEIKKVLADLILSKSHPDLLYFPSDSKLGIEQAREIKKHFSLKPYSARGRVVAVEDASVATPEAQSALLKILEEPPPKAIIILGAPSDAKFLPTVLSRCQVIHIPDVSIQHTPGVGITSDIEKLLKSDMEERFEYIEKLKDREEFFHSLLSYFHQTLNLHSRSGNSNMIDFLKELLTAEEWAKQNVNIRAILEYLMLVMPKRL